MECRRSIDAYQHGRRLHAERTNRGRGHRTIQSVMTAGHNAQEADQCRCVDSNESGTHSDEFGGGRVRTDCANGRAEARMKKNEIQNYRTDDRSPDRCWKLEEVATKQPKEGMFLWQAIDRLTVGQDEMQTKIG